MLSRTMSSFTVTGPAPRDSPLEDFDCRFALGDVALTVTDANVTDSHRRKRSWSLT